MKLALRLLVVSLATAALSLGPPADAKPGAERVPTGKALKALVEEYLSAPFTERERLRTSYDERFAPLKPSALKRLRADLLKIMAKRGKRLARSGKSFWFDEESKSGKYIVQGKPGKALFIGLHGGGVGAGSAESAAGAMGGGGWMWIFPEVLKKTERGWTDTKTDEFVMELVEAAKRSGKVDPNRIYITGHSMGGFGAWTLGAQHADVFGGVAAYAGAPIPEFESRKMQKIKRIEPGILSSYFALPLHFYQSGDDKNVPPDINDFAFERLKELKVKWPDGYNFRYDRVEGRGHAAPQEGYLPSLKWLASQPRDPRPKKFLWQPVIVWKRQMYWIYWGRAEDQALVEFHAPGGNRIEVTTHEGSGDVTGMSVLLGAPLVDVTKEVTVVVNGTERFKGMVEHRFSTLMMTLPRNDPHLLFDARVDLTDE